VAILVELSVLTRTVELIKGCEEKVVIPLNVAVPIKVFVEVPVPNVIDPVVKLDPINIEEVTEEALITLTTAVDMFKAETLIEDRVCVPDQTYGCVLT
jgi:hypothetical protein